MAKEKPGPAALVPAVWDAKAEKLPPWATPNGFDGIAAGGMAPDSDPNTGREDVCPNLGAEDVTSGPFVLATLPNEKPKEAGCFA